MYSSALVVTIQRNCVYMTGTGTLYIIVDNPCRDQQSVVNQVAEVASVALYPRACRRVQLALPPGANALAERNCPDGLHPTAGRRKQRPRLESTSTTRSPQVFDTEKDSSAFNLNPGFIMSLRL